MKPIKSCILMFIVTAFLLTTIGCGSVKQSYLDSFVNSERASLPKRLFANLNAIDVQAGELELIYICRLKDTNDKVAKEGQRRTQMALQDYVKRNQEGLQDLIDNQIKLTIALLSQKDETELFRLTVNPWEIKPSTD